MELKLLLGLVTSILGSLVGKMIIPHQAPPAIVNEPIKPPIIVERKVSRSELRPPSFVVNVPQEHFAGISEPSNSISNARKSAIDDVIRQILRSIGTQYDHKYFDRVSGNTRNIQRVIDDSLSGTAHGIVLDVERNIVKSSCLIDGSGKFVYFVLVYYPGKKIQEMRRLSKGAEVIASAISYCNGHVRLKISEINGVAVTMSSADVKVLRRNRFAKAITLFFWRVPKNTEQNYTVYFDPVKVCGNSKTVEMLLEKFQKNFDNFLLGAEFKTVIVLKGDDEIGRPISLDVAL